MENKERVQDYVQDYGRFKKWLRDKKGLKISEARTIGFETFVDEFEDWVIDNKYRDKRSFEKRTGINYTTFQDWVRRRTGKKMGELTEYEKDDLVIEYKVERKYR